MPPLLQTYLGHLGKPSIELPLFKLKKAGARIPVAPRHDALNAWLTPFFFEDRRHVFYVTTKKSFVPPQQWFWFYGYYGVFDNSMYADIPLLVMPEYRLPGPGPYESGLMGFESTSPSMTRFVSEDAYIKRLLPMTGTVRLNGAQIGPAGGVIKATQNQ
jgi:hypothetical protein